MVIYKTSETLTALANKLSLFAFDIPLEEPEHTQLANATATSKNYMPHNVQRQGCDWSFKGCLGFGKFRVPIVNSSRREVDKRTDGQRLDAVARIMDAAAYFFRDNRRLGALWNFSMEHAKTDLTSQENLFHHFTEVQAELIDLGVISRHPMSRKGPATVPPLKQVEAAFLLARDESIRQDAKRTEEFTKLREELSQLRAAHNQLVLLLTTLMERMPMVPGPSVNPSPIERIPK
jgi:hypothetical protein